MRQQQRYYFSTLHRELDSLLISKSHPGVLRLTLNRPKQRNALSFQLLQAMEQQLDRLKTDGGKNIRAVVIHGNGPAFCSGHDLKEMTDPESKISRKDLFLLCSRVMQLVEEIPQPVIAAVHGVATAAGLQLVAAADLAVASSDSRFATPGVGIGLFCSTPAVPLVRAVGKKAANDLLFTGRLASASEAKAMGLISHICETDQVLEEAERLASSIASRSGKALALGKQTLLAQRQLPLAEAYAVASQTMCDNMDTVDACEGIEAFLQKRTPSWKHE